MAKVKKNPALDGLSGKLGNVVYKTYGDDTYVGKMPVFTVPWSPDQTAHRSRMKVASHYAEAVEINPEARAYYVAKLKKKKRLTVRNAAISDFFTKPEVSDLSVSCGSDRVGAKGTVWAAERWGIRQVDFTLRRLDKTVIEQGTATLTQGEWRYTFTQPLPAGVDWEIVANATDLPGNGAAAVLDAGAVKWV
jgi:hypothetical protein